MADFKKIEYYNLRAEANSGKLPELVGRAEELERLTRVAGRRINNNCIIVGAAGSGKTTLLRGFAKAASQNPANQDRQYVQFDSEHIHELGESEGNFVRYQEALATLPRSTVIIDDFGRVISGNSLLLKSFSRLYTSLLKKSEVQLILSVQPQEYAWIESEHTQFLQSFETIILKNQTLAEYTQIVSAAVPRLTQDHPVAVPATVISELVGLNEKFPKLGQLPRSGIALLDECLSAAVVAGKKELTEDIVERVVASKTGVPVAKLKHDELSALANLETDLAQRIIGQDGALKKISAAIQRAALGMRNPNKPRGSFLMLGPSGVGKTETAKLIAEKMFGHTESFIRFDMSEFAQEHTVARLIGAPAGYIGHDEGGALTNALKHQPHSLILLDEIEKAHSKVFDIFLQVLDDGRLTSGQNETVDARHAIIMMTSNIGVADILDAVEAGADINDEAFIKSKLMPALSQSFRLEFLNRFDHILAFNPLGLDALMRIAELEIKKVEARLAKHDVTFQIDPAVLRERLKTMADPRFGARPVKRFIEETCESLLVRSFFNQTPKV